MRLWRIYILVLLLVAPFLFLMGMGAWWLWREEWWSVASWPFLGCIAAAYTLAWWWQRKQRLLPGMDFAAPLHWTKRDEEAWRLVEARAQAVKEIPASRLMDLRFYLDTAQDMALELARFYYPKAQDPIGALTIPEILAVVELATSDLAEMADDYVPAGHLLTINHWRNAGKVADWYSRVSKSYWAVSALFAPLATGARYAASQLGLGKPLQALQGNVLAWFYTAFVHRVGTYLIDLHSGRLKVGAKRYRELLAQARGGEPSPDGEQKKKGETEKATGAEAEPATVTITVLGQVKVGKSSLINALLGEQQAATDVLPLTAEITEYRLQPAGSSDRLVLFDTVGYTHEGPRADGLKATLEAMQRSDLVLLVLHARDPARQPDLELLDKLAAWFNQRPNLKMPRVLAVLTHIDLLPPGLEWLPPYDCTQATRPKEKSIRDAVAVVAESLGQRVASVVPVCTAPGKAFGVEEWLLPQLVTMLDEARAVGFLRCLHAESDSGQVRKVLDQLLAAGKQLFSAAWHGPAEQKG